MIESVLFKNIMVRIPHEAIYARLGYRKGLTITGAGEQKEINEFIEQAASLIRLEASALIKDVKIEADKVLIDDTGDVFESASLCRMLKGSSSILLMGVTAGGVIMEEITNAMKKDDAQKAVVMDAAASEITDSALDWLMDYFNRVLVRQQRGLTKKRFSAGYGDFSLFNQEVFYRLLRLDEIGIKLTESFMLIPEKSVTAIAGIF